MSDVITLGGTPEEDYTQSLDYWIKYKTFGRIDEDYQEQPDYITAQQFWTPIKVELLDMFKNKDKTEVVRFINNLTLMCFYSEKEDYCVSLIIKDGVIKLPSYNGLNVLFWVISVISVVVLVIASEVFEVFKISSL